MSYPVFSKGLFHQLKTTRDSNLVRPKNCFVCVCVCTSSWYPHRRSQQFQEPVVEVVCTFIALFIESPLFVIPSHQNFLCLGYRSVTMEQQQDTGEYWMEDTGEYWLDSSFSDLARSARRFAVPRDPFAESRNNGSSRRLLMHQARSPSKSPGRLRRSRRLSESDTRLDCSETPFNDSSSQMAMDSAGNDSSDSLNFAALPSRRGGGGSHQDSTQSINHQNRNHEPRRQLPSNNFSHNSKSGKTKGRRRKTTDTFARKCSHFHIAF